MPPSMYAVSDADVLGVGEAAGEAGALGEGEAEGDGDAAGGCDPASPDAEPATRWPAGMSAEPVVTRVLEPTGGGARAGTGAWCPLRCPATWGELTGQAKLRGRPRPQNHAWIAACCLRYGIPLVALNSADWGDFAEHHGLILLGEREGGRRR